MSDTVRSAQLRFVGVLVAALLMGTFIVHVLAASASESFAAERCTHPQKQLIAEGKSPSNKLWAVTAAVQNNGSCRTWLFSMDFRPSGGQRGSSRWAWRIPPGGHLSNKFTINAQDESAGSDRAFYGAVGARVRAIELIMNKGKRIVVHPKLPPLAMRERFVWLRNVRYVLRYYPAGEHVHVARLLNARGGLIDVARGSEGEFS
jgi:hypothetical protein